MTSFVDPATASLARPRGPLGFVQGLLDRINALAALAGGLAMGVAGLVLTWEVIGRYFLKIASDWQDELSAFLLLGATFMSAGWVQRRRGHVGIDALAHVLPAWADNIRRLIADALTLAFCGFFCWKCWTLLGEALEDGQISGSAWGPPLWIPYGLMSVGMSILVAQLVLQLLLRDGARARP
jgi:TRAP-type C4-dicarboxylate transport system permease small subunit